MSPNRHPNLLNRDKAVLVVVDLQEPFLTAVINRESTLERSRFLIQVFQLLKLPILLTVQNAARLGGLVPEVADLASVCPAQIDKTSFSCLADGEFARQFAALNRSQVLLCGVEAHICVAQTALDLVHAGCQVHVVADAVTSRHSRDCEMGMQRMVEAGARTVGSEAALYELLADAASDEFRAALNLVKRVEPNRLRV